MSAVRKAHNCLQASVEALREREWQATYTLDRQIKTARERMGEDRWRRLNQEWEGVS